MLDPASAGTQDASTRWNQRVTAVAGVGRGGRPAERGVGGQRLPTLMISRRPEGRRKKIQNFQKLLLLLLLLQQPAFRPAFFNIIINTTN